MRYMGGKFRQGKTIASAINHVLLDSQWYVEPFCGALGVATHINHDKVILSDVSESLINMWKALQDPNLVLPDTISEEEYNQIKKIKDPSDWRTAYYGFGMSFGGKWFGGYARSKSKFVNFARSLKNSTEPKRKIQAQFICSSYDQLDIPPDSFIYCDPPYEGRTKVHNFDVFNHDKFWDWVIQKIGCGHAILITEFKPRKDFVSIYNFGDTVIRHHLGKAPDGTQECLMCHISQQHLWEDWQL